MLYYYYYVSLSHCLIMETSCWYCAINTNHLAVDDSHYCYIYIHTAHKHVYIYIHILYCIYDTYIYFIHSHTLYVCVFFLLSFHFALCDVCGWSGAARVACTRTGAYDVAKNVMAVWSHWRMQWSTPKTISFVFIWVYERRHVYVNYHNVNVWLLGSELPATMRDRQHNLYYL